MSKRTLTQLKAWFEKEDKPTQAQFWDWLDSFFHKDHNIPSKQVEGLQGLLDSKVDKKDLTQNKGVWDPDKAYVFDANQAQYVSFVNADSTDDFFTTERWFRLDADTTAGQSPETHPEKWVHIGEVLGDVAIEDVLGLQSDLDKKLEDAPQDGKEYIRKDGAWSENSGSGTSNTFSETLIFRDLETFEFTKSQSYKITSVVSESGVTASVKLGGTSTTYTLGNTVAGFGRLDITVDVLGAITINGELV